MAAPPIDPYVADLERDNEVLIQALREALKREAVLEGERDQLATRCQSLEFDLAWNEHSRIELHEQLERERDAHLDTQAHVDNLAELLADVRRLFGLEAPALATEPGTEDCP
ncbi:MAG TPA: hypothetical protein VK083_07665 [Nocardia sp.]|uniref:hypothetical protein n=1 Tax=Nocardia sp. TaxID=1821 RepID=UPI002B4B9593|nr:hypothetical protein [Nocardia sp.]HLS76647.1 hypothetical protein [Nocardia sp.]